MRASNSNKVMKQTIVSTLQTLQPKSSEEDLGGFDKGDVRVREAPLVSQLEERVMILIIAIILTFETAQPNS
jgi:hypothetical protein